MTEAAETYKLDHERRPRVATRVTSWQRDGWNSSGIQLTITRQGIELDGWYDSMVGISGFVLSWAKLEELKAQVMA